MPNKKLPPVFQKNYKLMSKDEVIKQYQQDYENLLSALANFSETKIEDKFLDGWGIKEIIAHICSWNLETIRGIKTVLNGEVPWFFNNKEKINEFNNREVSKKKDISFSLLLEELNATHKILIGFLGDLPNNSFHNDFGKRWKNEKVTPSLVCSYRHYLHHVMDIVKHVDRGIKTGED